MKDTADTKTIDMLTAKKSGAERQKSYREKQKKIISEIYLHSERNRSNFV